MSMGRDIVLFFGKRRYRSAGKNRRARLTKTAGAFSRKGLEMKTPENRTPLAEIRHAVEQALGQPNRFARDAAIYFMRVRILRPSKEIGSFYSLSPSTVGAITRKMKKNLAWNIVVKNVLDCVEEDLAANGL